MVRWGKSSADDKDETLHTKGWLRPCVWHAFKGQPKTVFSLADGFVPFEAVLAGGSQPGR
jgi:hypothetical protein